MLQHKQPPLIYILAEVSHHLQRAGLRPRLVGFQYCLSQYNLLPAGVECHEKEGPVHVIGHKMQPRQQSHKQEMSGWGAFAQGRESRHDQASLSRQRPPLSFLKKM
ncbi:hypothetical protein NC651_031977 [Populus alba x Populus x berolinensis]|nr:hypothetical protein NC651_031977 [Populus alba x Populus x berolinensis]